MTTTPDPSPPRSLELDIELGHPPKKVWRALTEPALLSQWLLPIVELELSPGATFAFTTDPHPGWDGRVDCELIEADAPHRLVYAWRVPGLDTLMTFTLAPTDAGTRLSIVQSGFAPDQRRELGGARYGWQMMTSRLVELLDAMEG